MLSVINVLGNATFDDIAVTWCAPLDDAQVDSLAASDNQPVPPVRHAKGNLAATGRALSYQAVREYCERHNLDATGLQIGRSCPTCGSNQHGAPTVSGPAVRISLAHSGTRVLVAVAPARYELGVDVEYLPALRRDQSMLPWTLLPLWAQPSESATDDVEKFGSWWTRAEAIGKMTGAGVDALNRAAPQPEPTCVAINVGENHSAALAWRERPGHPV